jgi:cysteine synthase A
MPEGVSNERVLIIRAYGGEVKLTSGEDGIQGAIAEVERLGTEPDIFLPRQFSNLDNAEAHRVGTAREVIDQISGGRVDAVVSGVGTGGTLVGLFEGLSECGCPVIPVLAKPVNLMRTPEAECCSFSGKIPGVADSLSSIFAPERVSGLITIEIRDEIALATTRELIRLGFPVGPSSGLNFRAAVEVHTRLSNRAAQIVTVFPDRMEKYFTTELFKPFL